jgi:hypothetical protein
MARWSVAPQAPMAGRCHSGRVGHRGRGHGGLWDPGCAGRSPSTCGRGSDGLRFWRDARRTSSTGSDLHSCLGVYGSQRGRRDSLCPKAAASRAGEGGRRSGAGPADPRVQPEHRQGLMTISMPDRFRLAAPRGRRRRIGIATGLLEQSRLASCPRPGRTKSTPLSRRRIAAWRLEWPPRVARARRDGRDGSCASGRPRDVGHRCERWRALERERSAALSLL